uniref:Uncharacterized protein n=1 Tax=Opuntia streptacantha TaxID=393608 RepID=A0A7C9AXS3_OPUST
MAGFQALCAELTHSLCFCSTLDSSSQSPSRTVEGTESTSWTYATSLFFSFDIPPDVTSIATGTSDLSASECFDGCKDVLDAPFVWSEDGCPLEDLAFLDFFSEVFFPSRDSTIFTSFAAGTSSSHAFTGVSSRVSGEVTFASFVPSGIKISS